MEDEKNKSINHLSQQIRILALLPEDQGSVSSTYIMPSQTFVMLVPGNSMLSSKDTSMHLGYINRLRLMHIK